MPGSFVILITDIFLVLEIDAYGLGTRFITVGFAVIVVGAVLALVVLERRSHAAADAIESGDERWVWAAVGRITGFGAVDTFLEPPTISAMGARRS